MTKRISFSPYKPRTNPVSTREIPRFSLFPNFPRPLLLLFSGLASFCAPYEGQLIALGTQALK